MRKQAGLPIAGLALVLAAGAGTALATPSAEAARLGDFPRRPLGA